MQAGLLPVHRQNQSIDDLLLKECFRGIAMKHTEQR
jgi:hypothetical protein